MSSRKPIKIKDSPLLLEEERHRINGHVAEVIQRETYGIKRTLSIAATIGFFSICVIFAISISSLFISEGRRNELLLQVTQKYYFANTSTTPSVVTTGEPPSTTGLTVDNDHSFNVSYFLVPSDFIPYSLSISFDTTFYSNPSIINLNWEVLDTNYISKYNIYQSESPITEETISYANKHSVTTKGCILFANLLSGKTYIRVESIFLDSSSSGLSEEFLYDSTSRVVAFGNPLGDLTSDEDLFIFDDLSIVDGNGASKRILETTMYIASITYDSGYHFSSNGEFVGWISNNLNDSSSRSVLKIARTSGNTTSYIIGYSLLTNSTSMILAFGFSRDCKSVFFICNCTRTNQQLYVSDINGTDIRLMSATLPVVMYSPISNIGPIFTLDSQRIIWLERSSGVDTIKMRKIDLSDSATIVGPEFLAAPEGTFTNSFKMTPDGRYVIYTANHESLSRYDVYKVLLSNQNEAVLMTPTRSIDSTDTVQLPIFISPTSEFIVYSFLNTLGYRTYFSTPIASDGTSSLVITQTPTIGYTFPVNLYDVISPDGSMFAFSIINSSNCELFVGSIRGRFDPYMVTSGESVTGCSISSFKWSRNGGNQYIVMHSKYDLSYPMLYVIDVKLLTTTRISTNTLGHAHVKDYSLTDDGKNVLYIADERSNGRNEIFINSIPPTLQSKLFGAVGSLTRDYTTLKISSISGIQYRLNGQN
jgi:hypothetical protein